MAVNIVTGMTGIEHITSHDDRARNASQFGRGKYVFDIGRKFSATAVDDNLVRIQDGMCINQGTQMGIEPNDYADVEIDNGLLGTNRHDIIVMRYEKNEETLLEKASLAVVKGVNSSEPVDPDITEGNILDGGDLVDDMPLYRVVIEGVNLLSIEPLFEVLDGDVGSILEELNNKVDKVTGKGLSTNDYTNADKEDVAKIDTIEHSLSLTSTATGNPISISDSAHVNAEELVVTLEPIQSGSGDPSPDNVRPITGWDVTELVVKDDATNPTVTDTYALQFGETVYGAEVDFVSGVATVTKGYIAEYAGETLPSTWISDRDVYASGTTPTTGAEVVYELATPYTIQLTPQQIKMLKGNNVLVADGEMSLTYQVDSVVGDIKEWTEEQIEGIEVSGSGFEVVVSTSDTVTYSCNHTYSEIVSALLSGEIVNASLLNTLDDVYTNNGSVAIEMQGTDHVICISLPGYIATSGSVITERYNTVIKIYSNNTIEAFYEVQGKRVDYSTSEKIIGTWIDGSTVYEKTIDCGQLPAQAGTKNVAHNISNLENIVKIEGISYSSTTFIPLPFSNADDRQYNVYIYATPTDVVLTAQKPRDAFANTYVTLQYTKTTD